MEAARLATLSYDYIKCARNARRARRVAEEAFSHPSILAQLNFPDQHKIAMYMPLFMPAGAAILTAFTKELQRYVRRMRAASAMRKKGHSKIE